jgi:hypothetical protein
MTIFLIYSFMLSRRILGEYVKSSLCVSRLSLHGYELGVLSNALNVRNNSPKYSIYISQS